MTAVAIAPAPDAAPHDEPAVAVQVHVTPVKAGGKVSVTVAPVAMLGPLFVTTIVHVSGVPAATGGALGVFVTARSATSSGVAATVRRRSAGSDRSARSPGASRCWSVCRAP